MAQKRLIAPVANRADKHNTYTVQMGRYRKAMQHEFYFEGMLIDYAVLEDRLRAFLYYIGVLADDNAHKAWTKTAPSIRLLMTLQGQQNTTLGITNISGKMRILRTTLVFAMTTQGIPNGDPYLAALKSAYEGAFDVSDVLRTLDRIEKWCAYRNEVIHALMNKSVCSLQEELSDRCDEGMKLAREIDGYVKQLKQRNAIRTALKAPKSRR